ncbi:hypothetical protein RLOatenuis_8410 [Rickettsiales bacterium]|nr:hypothetical protein RLOatenuis_8410 [Rickettsiales bacterium]
MFRNNRSAPLTKLTDLDQSKAHSDPQELPMKVKVLFKGIGIYIIEILPKAQDYKDIPAVPTKEYSIRLCDTELTRKLSRAQALAESAIALAESAMFSNPELKNTQTLHESQHYSPGNLRMRKAIGFHFPEGLKNAAEKYKILRNIFIPDNHLGMEESSKCESGEIEFMRSSLLDCITSPEQNKDVMNSKEFNKFFRKQDSFGRFAFAYVLGEILGIKGFYEEDKKQKILYFLEENLSEECAALKSLELGEDHLQDGKEKVKNNRPKPSTVLRDTDQARIDKRRSELESKAEIAQNFFNNIKITVTQTILKGESMIGDAPVLELTDEMVNGPISAFLDPLLLAPEEESWNSSPYKLPRIRKAIAFNPKEDKSLLSNHAALRKIFVPENCLAMEQCYMDKEIPMPKRMTSSLLDCITSPEAEQNREMLDSDKLADFVKGHKTFGRMVFAYALRELSEHHKHIFKDDEKDRLSKFLEENLYEECVALQSLEIKSEQESKDIPIPQASAAYGGGYFR